MKLELMAPAKNAENLRAAVHAGADSIYLGLPKFNARQAGENFQAEDFMSAVEFAHANGKRVYLTLNILIKDSELQEAYSYVDTAKAAGVDALIIQDVGLARYISSVGLPIIASTQMTVFNHLGAVLLYRLGFSRVVLARELNIREIKDFVSAAPEIEHECFIHGGLCIAYSGQCSASTYFDCLASNRGLCKTPCWDMYSLYKNGEHIRTGHLIRPKDMFGLERIPELAEAGVTALKLQGRTRSPEYVSTVTEVYREAIDGYYECGALCDAEAEIERLKSVSPRGLMRGNLECCINSDFVVSGTADAALPESSCSPSVIQKSCEMAARVTAALYDIERLYAADLSDCIDAVYLPYDLFCEKYAEKISLISERADLYIIMPMISERNLDIYGKTEALLEKYPITGISVATVSDIEWVISASLSKKYKIHGERSLNITNGAAAEFFKQLGVEEFTLPLELSESDIKDMTSVLGPDKLERIVYGTPSLMRMKYCVLSASNECTDCKRCLCGDEYSMVGRNIYDITVCKSRCETTLWPREKMSLPIIEGDVGMHRLEFKSATAEQINEAARMYRSGKYLSGLKNECMSV